MRRIAVGSFIVVLLIIGFGTGWYLAWKTRPLSGPNPAPSSRRPSPPAAPRPVPALLQSPTISRGSPTKDLRETPIVRAVRQASPAVVHISTSRIQRAPASPFGPGPEDPFFEFFNKFFDFPEREYHVQSLGTGFLVHPDGYILTNEHVISRATNITVQLVDGRKLDARVVGSDPDNDVAVLKVETDEPLPVLALGDSDHLLIGEPVIAIGNPFGFDHTVTTGVISALHRSVRTENVVYRDFIQTDAAINPGNSGGPLLNIYGRVIGVNTAILAKGEGIGFAIPINLAYRIASDLIAFGKVRQTWWGLRLSERPPVKGKPQTGLRVEMVVAGSPADQAGVKEDDIILKINDHTLRNLDDFYRVWAALKPGDRVALTMRRAGETVRVSLRLRVITANEAMDLLWQLVGLRGEWLDEETVRHYGLPNEARWALTKVRRGSPAGRVGFRPGDVIYQLNDQYMVDEDHLTRAAVTLPQRENVTVRVIRGRYIYTVTLPVGGKQRLRII